LWRAFRRGFNGQLLWTIAQWSVNPWDNPWYSASNGNALLYYPHASGFVETLRLEAYTDAVEDYEYLTLLRNAAEGLASQDPQSPLIVEARSIYNAVDLGQKHERSNDLLEARQRIAELIMRINAQNAGRR